jgi:hypothetical protein
MVPHAAYEVIQAKALGTEYFRESLNFVDIALICGYIGYFVLRVFVSEQGSLIPDENIKPASWVLANSILSVVAFVKLLGYSRLFDDYSKLGSLLITVLKGLAPFNVLFFSIVIYDAFLLTISGSQVFDDKDDFPKSSISFFYA